MLKLVYSRPRDRQPAPWAEVSDRDLLMSIRDDDEGAFGELIGRKTHMLLTLAENILGDIDEARDVVQVTFFKVWENRKRFDFRWSPNTWIYRIASNLAIDHLRSRRTREKSVEPVRRHLRQVLGPWAEMDVWRLERDEISGVFRDAAAALSDKQRIAFVLHEVEGLAYDEIGKIVGCGASAVRNYVFYARQHLRRELLRRYPEYTSRFVDGTQEDA
jgi:RNA polymerase sigma-70 factor (ECF subfamily)